MNLTPEIVERERAALVTRRLALLEQAEQLQDELASIQRQIIENAGSLRTWEYLAAKAKDQPNGQ